MTEINLLPWRESLRLQMKKEWLILLSVVIVIAICILGTVCTVLKTRIAYIVSVNKALQHKTNLLSDNIAQINAIQLQRRDLAAKATVLQLFQLERSHIAPILEQIVVQMPMGMYLTRLDKKGGQLRLEGIAESTVSVSRLMHNLAQSPWLKEPRLLQIKTEESKGGSKTHRFEIVLSERIPNDAGGSDGSQ